MTKTQLTEYDSAQYLKTDEDIAAYLEAILEENDPTLFSHALGVVARAYGMTQLARESGLSRESLYKSLSANGNPEFSTVLKILKALGLKWHITKTHQLH